MTDRDQVIAVDTPDVGDQIDLLHQIEARARRRDLPAVLASLDGHAEPFEDVLDGLIGQLQPQDPRHPLGAQVQRRRARQMFGRADLAHRPRLAADDVEQQARGALDGAHLEFWIDATLETVRGIGVQPVATRLAADGQRREEGAFEQDVARLGTDTGFRAAHDAGERDRAFGIGDDERVGAQGRLFAVEQRQRLAFAGHPHPDLTRELAQIEAMHRLTEFEQHIVGDIDHRADGANAAAPQPLAHPQRRARAGIDATDDAADIARAGFGRLQPDREALIAGRRDRLDGHRRQRHAIDDRDLARQPRQPETVAAIRGQIDLDALIVERQPGTEILAQGRVGGQRQDAVGGLGQTQFARRADHAERLDPAQLGALDLEIPRQTGADGRHRHLHVRRDIGRAADDLERGVLADIDRADTQLGGVRMRLDAEHMPDLDPTENRRRRFDRVDLQPRHAELIGQTLGIDRRVHPFAQPCLTESHVPLPTPTPARPRAK